MLLERLRVYCVTRRAMGRYCFIPSGLPTYSCIFQRLCQQDCVVLNWLWIHSKWYVENKTTD